MSKWFLTINVSGNLGDACYNSLCILELFYSRALLNQLNCFVVNVYDKLVTMSK